MSYGNGWFNKFCICRNCGNNHTGNYCNHCGEKVIAAHDKSIGHLAEEAFHFFTHFDNSFFNSFRCIVVRPGKFSHDYCNGTRKKYYKPVSLFFLLIVIYLLFPKTFPNGLNMPLSSYVHARNFSLSDRIANAKMLRLHIDFNTLSELYHHKSQSVSKLLLLILLPFSAFALAALYPRKAVYYDNFILATELNSFFLVFSFMLLPVVLELVTGILEFSGAHLGTYNFDSLAVPLFSIPFLLFCMVSFRRFFGSSWLQSGLRSLAFIALHFIIWAIIYKSLLFLAVMALIR